MNVSRFRLMIAIVPCLLALRASAQDLYRVARPVEMPRTWTVNASGGADFANLPPAVLAARSGDVLLVAPGVYSSFTLEGKGLTILGDGGTPTINGRTSVLSLPADEVVVLRSLKLSGLVEEGLRLRDNAGAVWVEDCTVEHVLYFLPTDTWLASDTSQVLIARTNVRSLGVGQLGVGHAFHVLRGEAHVWGSTFQGTTPGLGSIKPGAGAKVEDAFLQAAGSTFRGGNGVHCQVIQCWPAGNGGDGLDAAGAGTAAKTLACTFQGGFGGAAASVCSCPAGASGAPFTGPVQQEPLPMRSYEVETPVRSGTSYQITADCEPGEFVWSVFAEELEPLYVPNYFGTQVGALPVTLVFEGVADGTGSLVKTVPVPPLAGLTSFERLYAQGLFFDEFNNAYLGSPSVLVVVN